MRQAVHWYMRVSYANISVFCTHIYACFVPIWVYVCFVPIYMVFSKSGCASKVRIYTRPKDTYIYMRLKCLVKSIHSFRAHISRTHFETNGQPYDITGKYLYVKFPRMKTLRCKTFKIYIKIIPVQSNCPV